jgi:hypothetical protein
VDNAFLVRGLERLSYLDGVLQRLIERQRARKRFALDILHHQIVRADVVELTNVGMVQRSDGAGFTFEALAELDGRYLDGDDAVEACIAGLPYFAHTASA